MIMGMSTRDCGECVACCVSPEIPETKSAWKEPCPKLKGPEVSASACAGTSNCTVYEDRPQCCVDYNCAWIEGYGQEEDRPDKCGMLVDLREDVKGAPTAKALWPNAASEPAGSATLRRMSKDIGKPLLVARYHDFMIIEAIGSGYGVS